MEVGVARVLFVTGFNRSGTTLLTSAVTQASGGTTLTVGDLARHMPSLREYLDAVDKDGATSDRGVDRLEANASMPEEYGWLLSTVTGEFAYGEKAVASGILHTVVNELAENSGAPVVVLKNPWDTNRTQFLLDDFPDSGVLLVRRRLPAIEDSLSRAWDRMAGSNVYIRALIGNPDFREVIMKILLDPASREDAVNDAKQHTRDDAAKVAENAASLPLDRVAFLDYDEFRTDTRAAAAWAGHLVDPERLSGAITSLAFAEYNSEPVGSPEVEAIDEAWANAWRDVRAQQVAAGILPAPATAA
jgi:sulfotransferase family protein